MKRVSTVRFVNQYFDEALKDFLKGKKVIEIINVRETPHGYKRACEVVWDDEK